MVSCLPSVEEEEAVESNLCRCADDGDEDDDDDGGGEEEEEGISHKV
jgi:hypothetical protein